MKPDRILVVEDQATSRMLMVDELISMGVPIPMILEADCIEEARELFRAWKGSIVAICLDGCLHDIKLNTIPLIEFFVAEGYEGILIAMSSHEPFREQMCAARPHRLTHPHPKEGVSEFLVDLLRQDD